MTCYEQGTANYKKYIIDYKDQNKIYDHLYKTEDKSYNVLNLKFKLNDTATNSNKNYKIGISYYNRQPTKGYAEFGHIFAYEIISGWQEFNTTEDFEPDAIYPLQWQIIQRK